MNDATTKQSKSSPCYVQMLVQLSTNQIDDLEDLMLATPMPSIDRKELAQAQFHLKQYREQLRYILMMPNVVASIEETRMKL